LIWIYDLQNLKLQTKILLRYYPAKSKKIEGYKPDR